MMEKAEILMVRLDNFQRRYDALILQLRAVIDDPELADREKLEAIDELMRAEDGTK